MPISLVFSITYDDPRLMHPRNTHLIDMILFVPAILLIDTKQFNMLNRVEFIRVSKTHAAA
jgi:hypothetical protein